MHVFVALVWRFARDRSAAVEASAQGALEEGEREGC
jgi:hypothetical protein